MCYLKRGGGGGRGEVVKKACTYYISNSLLVFKHPEVHITLPFAREV